MSAGEAPADAAVIAIERLVALACARIVSRVSFVSGDISPAVFTIPAAPSIVTIAVRTTGAVVAWLYAPGVASPSRLVELTPSRLLPASPAHSSSAIRNLRGRDVEPSTAGDHSSNVRATSEAGSITDRRQASDRGRRLCLRREPAGPSHMGGVCFARERMRRANGCETAQLISFCGCRGALMATIGCSPCRDEPEDQQAAAEVKTAAARAGDKIADGWLNQLLYRPSTLPTTRSKGGISMCPPTTR